MKIDKMFALDNAFMFRFEAEPGQPENENHKIIPTYRAIEKIGIPVIQDLMRQFLSKSDIKWHPFNWTEAVGESPVYHSKTHGDAVGFSPTIVTAHGITKKVVWVMVKEDIYEVNGIADDGNNRARLR